MLTKNVYILYPAGYGGSFINWAINASDADTAKHTVLNPINCTASSQLGGVGTSHLHTRLPTHQHIDWHIAWQLYNKPTDKRVYIVNSSEDEAYDAISRVIQFDPDAVFIYMHGNNSSLLESYGIITGFLKWPTNIDIRLTFNNSVNHGRKLVHDEFDPFNCKHDRLFRNWVVLNDSKFKNNHPLDQDLLLRYVNKFNRWYDIRNKFQPHEVNEQFYIKHASAERRVFELSIDTLFSNDFLQWFTSFMDDSKVSDQYDCTTVSSIHPEYLSVQSTLQWFKSIAQWEETGELDDFLLSHSIIESQLIKLIFQRVGKVILSSFQRDHWISTYIRLKGVDWPPCNEDAHYFWYLPDWVQAELIEFGYVPVVPFKPVLEFIDVDWQNMSTTAINEFYQKHKDKIR